MRRTHGKFSRRSMETNGVTSRSHSENRGLLAVDKPKRDTMTPNLQIVPSRRGGAAPGPKGSVDRRIRAFLNGESDGEDVLGALYGGIADEPVPERLRSLLKN